MKRFIVEVDDSVDKDDIKEFLYHGSREKKVWKSEPIEVRETWETANGKHRMTTKQRDALWAKCGGYNVEFSETHYFLDPANGRVEGWIGGPEYAARGVGSEVSRGKKTIYVGVSPEGEINS